MGFRDEEKLVPNSHPEPDGLAPKLCHLGCHMGQMSVRTGPEYKALGPNLMKSSNLIDPNFERLGRPSIWPKYKVALIKSSMNVVLCEPDLVPT